MSIPIDTKVYKALEEMGVDSSHLDNLSYTIPDWDISDILKQSFPVNAEGMLLTNGKEMFVVEASPDDASYFQGVMRLKTLSPHLPVYEIHNHPSIEAYEDDEDRQRQALVSSVPSKSDMNRWQQLYSLVGAGIYATAVNELRLFSTGDIRNRIGTKLALEPSDDGSIEKAYWVPEEEKQLGIEYIQPSEWTPAILSRIRRSTFAKS